MTDIISAIDAATGCQHCGNPLGSSPSSDFCGEGCQQAWAAKRVGTRPPHLAERLAELASQVDPQSWSLSNPPDFRTGDLMTVQGLSGPAETYRFDGHRWLPEQPVDEATAGAGLMIEQAQHHLGVELAPWQRSMVEQYCRHRP